MNDEQAMASIASAPARITITISLIDA